ncbi:MAG: signal peptidase II [Christensenellales bacterium]|jgi:signal peptidase II
MRHVVEQPRVPHYNCFMTMKDGKRRWGILLALAVLVLDQGSKALWGEATGVVIPGVLHLVPTRNTGIAFGLLQGSSGAVLAMAGVALMVLFARLAGRGGLGQRIAWALMIGGALGNVADRLRLGYVVDFLALTFMPWFPVFNVADAALVVGVALLVLMEVLGGRKSVR